MDVKDLRTEAALSERNNDGSKYTQSVVALHCNRNKSYQDIGSNALGKAEGAPVRPCAVIGPDRVVPPPAFNDPFLKKGSVEPWPSPDDAYRRPPEYPHRLSNPNPTRNISPRQTFQENMQRINVPPTYNAVRHSDSAHFNQVQDRNVSISKNVKPNMAPEAKYCDVPYAINSLANEPKSIREPEMYMQSVNPSLTRTVPHVWPPGSVNVAAPRTYSASDSYQYQQYSNCANQRPTVIPVARPHRTIQEDAAFMYSEHYYPDANARFKPFPHVKERYPQPRYEYLGNYPGQFHPPPPIQPPKYDIPKSGQNHPYPVYPHVKYLENRVPEPTMESYQRQANHQPHYNIPFRNQVVHPPYGQVPSSTPQKVHPYPPEASIKAVASNKLHFENNTKMYIDYENARSKPYQVADNYFVNEMNRYHQVKNPMGMPNYSPLGMRALPPHQYYVKDNPQMRPFEYMPHFRNFEPHLNASVLRHAPHFSPNTHAISPTDSSASNDTLQTHGTSQEDCGYVSQSSSASVRSLDSGIYRLPHEYYKKPEYKYGPVVGSSPTLPKTDVNSNDKQKQMNVRQFLSMWNEGEEENPESTNSKEIIIQTGSSETSNYAKHHASNQDQLYVLGLVNVPSEELSKYEHIEKISKLPENIKGYNNLELYSRFEEAMESCNTTPKMTPKEYQMPCKEQPAKMFVEPLPRPMSPLDVEAKISQSVIHKEVGCNFEIRPCTPKMLNVEVAASAQNVLGERSIEKVANPNSKIEKSPLPTKSDENLNCNAPKKQENSFAITDNPSCKMTCSPYSSNNLEPIKANYSLQDFNSGVCLASLPQLDNEIELNFPEVNQQFINANKGDCLSPAEGNYKSSIQQSESGLAGNGNNESDLNEKSNSHPEKALNKLSKYRKLKASIEKNIRTDSVIIKNPENIKNLEDKSLGNSFNPMNLCSPINLSSQSSHWHDSPSEPHENKDAEMALDFSLNKAANDLLIIDVEKDIVTKPFQRNNFSLATDSDLERKLVMSPETKSFSKETTQEANEVAPQCIKKDQTDLEYHEPESPEINDASISHIKDSLLSNPSNYHKSNDNYRCLNINDYKEDVSDILETRKSVVPKQLDFSTVENDLTSNKEKGWLSINEKAPGMETSCDKYCENVKKVFSPDQFSNIEKKIDNDFEHDEISANLEKLFRESDEDLPKSDQSTGLNTADISINSEATHTSESLLENTNTLHKTSYRINKELFSPWMQKLLTYNEGICLFSNYTTIDNTLCEKEITKQLKESDHFERENDVKVDNVPVSAIKSQSIAHKRMAEENLDNYLGILSKKSKQIPSKSLTEQCDTRKIKKICIKKISGNSTKTFSGYAINKKEMKKRKKRLHKFKSTSKSQLSDQILCTDELRVGPQTEPPCEHKHEINSEGIIEKTNIMSSNESIKQTKDFIPENVLQNCYENQNTSDEAIDSSDVSKNALNLGNSANKISLTENYSKILTYCNTPEDEEQISTHDSDNNIEFQHIKQPRIALHESKEDGSTDSSKEIAHCLINIDSDNDPNKLSSRADKSTNYVSQESCASRFSPCESGIMAAAVILGRNVPPVITAVNSETVLDGHLEAKNIEHQKTKKVENKEIIGSCISVCLGYSKESLNEEIKAQNISDDALSCTDDISKPLHSDTAAEDLIGSSVHDQNMEGPCVICDNSLVEIPNRSLDKIMKELKKTDQNHLVKEKSSFNDSNNLIPNEYSKESTTGTPLSNVSSELLSSVGSLDKANKELNTIDLNYSLKDGSSFNDSNDRIANEELKESATDTPLNSRASELLSIDKSLDKANKELNTSDQNSLCLEDSSYNDSNNLIANEELNEIDTHIPLNILASFDSSNKLDEGIIEDSENLQLGKNLIAVVTDICDIICDAQVGEANKQNINEEENVPNYDNIVVIENKKQPIVISENSMRDFADTADENISNSSMNNQHKTELISATESNVGIPSECENSILNHKSDLISRDFVDAVVSKDQPDKVNTGIVDIIFSENETGVAISEVLQLKSEINTSDTDKSGVIAESEDLKVVNLALNNLDTSISSKTNKEILALQKEFNKEIHTELPLECMIETKSIEVMLHKNVSDNYTTSEQINISTDEMPVLEKGLSVENNDLHKDVSSNLNKCESDQNNTMLDYKPKNDPTNNSNSIPDKWIEEKQPSSPNKEFFSTTEEDFILYDNSEESLCYPVVNNSLAEMENETCIIPDPCIHESPVKSRLVLKRSFSDSALNSIKTRDTSERQMLDNTPMWPSKRQKLYQFNQSEQQIISENICNFIQNNRRNSVSSYYNAENVSFCILIDDDCILTDENEEDKICFAEVAEDCMTETNTLEENVEEIVCCSEETELNLSDSVIMDYNDKSIQETWLDDVACVETVVSDDIVEEISNDGPLSPIDTNSEYEESGVLNSDLSDPTNGYNIENEDNIPANGTEMEKTSNSPYENDDVFHDREPLNPGHMICNVKNNESEKPLSYSDGCSPTSDYTHAFCTPENGNKSDLPEDKENIYDSNLEFQSYESNSNLSNNRANLEINCNTRGQTEKNSNPHSEEVYFPESSMDNVIFNYNKKEDGEDSYSPTSSSPEVSSTTSEDKSSSILLKITNYNGSRVSEVNEVNRNRPRCKFTESKDYSHSQENFPKRPLMTKAARKYIPPLKESIRDLKVQLPLPQQRLLKLKQLKLAKSKPKAIKQNNHTVPKKQKPNFEDVLKSIDEVQIKMHKEKNKKAKNIVPKVVIKKNENGSHYTSSSSKHSVDPDLTGRKWQPWVFLEKNHFIDNMAIRNKTKAIFSHRKNTYVLAEKFQKYKSASNCSAKFVISQPNSGDSSKGHLKYTIRLKHVY